MFQYLASQRRWSPQLSLRQLFQVLHFRPCCLHAADAAAENPIHPQLFISSFNGCGASPARSACRRASSKPAESVSSPLSSLLPLSLCAASVAFSSTLPLLAAVAAVGAAPRCCLRMVRRFLLRRDWLQCRVRLRCHWSREFWASTLS